MGHAKECFSIMCYIGNLEKCFIQMLWAFRGMSNVFSSNTSTSTVVEYCGLLAVFGTISCGIKGVLLWSRLTYCGVDYNGD